MLLVASLTISSSMTGLADFTNVRRAEVALSTSLSPNIADTTAIPFARPSCKHALILSAPAIPPIATTGMNKPGVLHTSFNPSIPNSLVTT